MIFSELIAIYLFLGGAAAGAFVVVSAIDACVAILARLRAVPLSARESTRAARAVRALHRLRTAVYAVAFVMVVVGLVCLLADLGKPEAFYLLFLYPTTSFMSIGSFALAIFAVCLIIVLAHSALELGRAWKRIAFVAQAVGVVAAIVVMAYTGLLLKNTVAVGLWQSAWLPVLFVASALSCGVAVVMLAAHVTEGRTGAGRFERALLVTDAMMVVSEAVSTVLFAVTVNAAEEGSPFDVLLAGQYADAFWLGFVGCGMLAPLVIEAVMLLRRRAASSAASVVAAVLVLMGGLTLRLVMVAAGVQPAV